MNCLTEIYVIVLYTVSYVDKIFDFPIPNLVMVNNLFAISIFKRKLCIEKLPHFSVKSFYRRVCMTLSLYTHTHDIDLIDLIIYNNDN